MSARANPNGPQRRCVVSRDRAPREGMLRFVVSPDRVIIPDPAATAPGRGLWLRATTDLLGQVLTRPDGHRQFARAASRVAKAQIVFPRDLPERLETALVARIVTTLGRLKRAKRLVEGVDAAAAMLASGDARLIVVARDGVMAERVGKLARARPGCTVVDPLTLRELRRVFSADATFVIASAPGGLCEPLSLDAARLMGLRQAIATGLAGTAVPGDHTIGAHG